MAYITREDGEHFVIPSYRDVLSAKNKNLLKKDILLLSQSYGEYITLQRKSALQYEVAFSPDPGYLLGESVWHYFKRPLDMIYCEAIPNTTEALLVIVKGGSVYLDGRFPIESIPEELIIFLTQQNNFEIFVYGDVPISQTPTEGKFSFEPSSVKSFTVLEKPVFPELPLLKIYQLQLVDQVLKAHGIGVFPTRQLLMGLTILLLGWLLYHYFLKREEARPTEVAAVNPYQGFNDTLTSPAPDQEINEIVRLLNLLMTMPGWQVSDVNYAKSIFTAGVKSIGGKVEDLFQWAKTNNLNVDVTPEGFKVVTNITLPRRLPPKQIYSLKQVMAEFVDKLASVYPGNHMRLGPITNRGAYLEVTFQINLENGSPLVLSLIGDQMKNLPFVLQSFALTVEAQAVSGTISIQALGSQL